MDKVAGDALAADSAVTMTRRKQNYLRAEKLLPLYRTPPVGSIDLTGQNPWECLGEILIEMYRKKFGERKLDRLEEYAQAICTY